MEDNFNQNPQEEKVEQPVAPVNEQPNINDDEPLVKEPKMKGLKIAIGVIVVLVIAAVGAFFFFKSQRTATKYIDTKVKDVTKSLEETLSSNTVKTIGTLDFTNEEIASEGSIKITASGNYFESLNNTEFTYDLKESFSKEYLGAKLGLKNSEGNVNGSVYLDGKTLYLDIKDVIDKPIKAVMEENIFNSLKSELNSVDLGEFKDLLDMDNLKDFSIKTVDFIGQALKETITNTNSKGLNVEYEFVFDSNSLNKAKDKFIALAKSDAKYTDFLKKLTGTDDLFSSVKDIEKSNEKMVVKIEVNVFTNKLENLTIIYNDKTILSKVDKDQYKFLYDENNDKNYAILTIKDDEFKIALYQEGKSVYEIEITSKKNETNIKFTISKLGGYVNINIKNINDNEEKATIDANLVVATIKAEINTKTTNDKISASGNVTAKISSLITGGSEESLKVDFNVNYQHGDNIVTKETPSNAVEIQDLDQASLQRLETFLEGLEESFSFLDSYGFGDDTYTDDYNYDFPESYDDFAY